MHVMFALLTMALGGDEGSLRPSPDVSASPQVEVRRIESPTAATTPMISYDVQYVTLSRSDWRGKFDPRLTPVARQGGAAVWATDAATLAEMLTFIQTDSACQILNAPRVVTPAAGEVRMTHGTKISYVAHLKRIADGPVDQASGLSFAPEIGEIHNGVRTRLSVGRLEAQGLLTRLAVERDSVLGFETSTYSENVVPKPADEARPENRGSRPHPARLASTIQIPLVESSRVDGEWIIPADGALIVSLGRSKAVKKKRGFGEQRSEELVVIRYRPEPGSDPTPITPEPVATARPRSLQAPSAN